MREREGRVCRRPLVFNLGFADEHYGDVIAYGIHAMALAALQPLSVMDYRHGCFAERADKNLQQIWINRHGENGSTGTRSQSEFGGIRGRTTKPPNS